MKNGKLRGTGNRADIRMSVISSLLILSFIISGYSGLVRADDETIPDETVISEESEITEESLDTEPVTEEPETADTEEETSESATEPEEILFTEQTEELTEETSDTTETIGETTSEASVTESTEVTEGTDETEVTDAPVVLNTYEAVSEDGISVTARAIDGSFDSEVEMIVEDIDPDDVIDGVNDTLDEETEAKDLVAVDISFVDESGNEIEPNDNYLVSVEITLPEDTELEGDDFTVIHLDDDGEGEELTDAEVSSTDASFVTESFSIYVMTATGLRSKDQYHAFLGLIQDEELENEYGFINNSWYQPYYLPIGESIEIIGYVDNPGTEDLHFSVYKSDMLENVSYEELYSSPSEVRIKITAIDTSSWENHVRFDFYGEEFHIVTLDKVDNTVPIDMDDPSFDNQIITVNYGDMITFSGHPYHYEPDQDWPFISDPSDSPRILSRLNDSESSDGIRSTTFLASTYDITATDQEVSFWTESAYRTVTIRVRDKGTRRMDHADIEIADGGVYTSVSFELGDDDGMIRTTTQYQSYVQEVNQCNLYKEDGSSVFFFHLGDNDSRTPKTDQCYTNVEYWNDPFCQIGDSQYELTSKYWGLDDNGNGKIDYPDEYRFNNNCFFFDDVDSARFDIDIYVVPLSVTKEKWDEQSQSWITLENETVRYIVDRKNNNYQVAYGNGDYQSINYDEIPVSTIENVVYDLGRQAVIDAYTKCPNHTGLDFTIHANSAMVQFEANKELLNKDLEDKEFTFELVECDEDFVPLLNEDNTEKIEAVENNVDGKIQFETRHYETPGNYYYIIREHNDGRDDIRYSNAIYKVIVEVSEIPDSGGILTANVIETSNNYNFKFINEYKIYKLPETGGIGVMPFYITGVLLIAAPLMVRSRAFIIVSDNKRMKGRKKKT